MSSNTSIKIKKTAIMNKVICVLLLFLSIGLYSQSPNVSFEYDDDGNMKLRKIIVTAPATIKRNQPDEVPVEDKLGEKKIVIYPNPTYGVFQLSVSGLSTKESNYYCLYSLNGTLLLKRSIATEITNVDISAFSVGAYLMDIYLGEKVSRWKVIKK